MIMMIFFSNKMSSQVKSFI